MATFFRNCITVLPHDNWNISKTNKCLFKTSHIQMATRPHTEFITIWPKHLYNRNLDNASVSPHSNILNRTLSPIQKVFYLLGERILAGVAACFLAVTLNLSRALDVSEPKHCNAGRHAGWCQTQHRLYKDLSTQNTPFILRRCDEDVRSPKVRLLMYTRAYLIFGKYNRFKLEQSEISTRVVRSKRDFSLKTITRINKCFSWVPGKNNGERAQWK